MLIVGIINNKELVDLAELNAELTTEVLEAVKKASKDGKITCTAARKVAGELKVAPKVIGEAADVLKLKITTCELGCF